MGLLNQDILNQEQLPVRACIDIHMGTYTMPDHLAADIREAILDGLEKMYGSYDLLSEDYFPSMYNDVPQIAYDYLYDMGYITKATQDNLFLTSRRLPPYWGVPESPSYNVGIETYPEDNRAIYLTVCNRIWENHWKGVDPVTYDRFINYMTQRWKPGAPFCHNPNPWKTLENMIANPKKYRRYGNTLR